MRRSGHSERADQLAAADLYRALLGEVSATECRQDTDTLVITVISR